MGPAVLIEFVIDPEEMVFPIVPAGRNNDDVIVNEEDANIKKNRLELIQMLCKTFDYYVNF